MKKIKIIILAVFCLGQLNGQDYFSDDQTTTDNPFYPTINLLIGNPIQEFWENYSKQRLWGFEIGVFAPLNRAPFFQPGVEFEMYPFGTDKANWNGLEVKTSGAFIKGNLVSRFRILNDHKISPFVEFAYGFNLSSTSTTYEIVDDATFWEEFLLDEEDEVEKVTVKDYTHTTHNINIGAGIIFNQLLNIHIKYNIAPGMQYVDRESVSVTETNVNYTISKTPMQMIVISVGFSLEKMFE